MRILVVEDDIDLLGSLVDSLRAEYYDISIASNGAKAKSALESNEFDLIVLDINLPDMSGFELLHEIRNKMKNQAQVIILSAKYELENRVKGLDCGADDYLAKPFSIIELKARIRALLRRNSPNKQVKINIGDIEINLADHKVIKGNSEIQLTPKEFQILELFFYNKNAILTSLQIAEHIYIDYFDKSSHIINMHIKNIRTKLQDQSIIETIRGVGFRLNG